MLLQKLKSLIYDNAIKFTADSYTEVFLDLKPNSRVLDVGVGTGRGLSKNADLIKDKNIHILGIDIDEAYLAQASHIVTEARLSHLVDIQFGDVCVQTFEHTFDAVYFSDSFMLIPEHKRIMVLKKTLTTLKDDSSRIYFTQMHETHRSLITEFIKPRLKLLTSIDFGLVTYESDFLKTLKDAGLTITFKKELSGNKWRKMMLIVTAKCT